MVKTIFPTVVKIQPPAFGTDPQQIGRILQETADRINIQAVGIGGVALE